MKALIPSLHEKPRTRSEAIDIIWTCVQRQQEMMAISERMTIILVHQFQY
jgi:hypothetical protein